MKMIQGSGSISNYGSFISNCQLKQKPYTVPVNYLSDIQLYINIGTVKPSFAEIELIITCGELAGGSYFLTSSDYVIGQDKNNNWYAVFKNISQVDPVQLTCFVIAVTLTFPAESGQSGDTENIYFSEEYCINSCNNLTLIKGCYGNLDTNISHDCEGIYFGIHSGSDTALGDTSIKYEHKLLLRDVEVSLSAIKNSFKQGRTRNFRTEKEKIFQFYGEFVPEWYLSEIDAVFYRGEVYIGSTKYLLNETQFEKIEDCFRTWKPSATFKESCYQSFSCEADPCAVPSEVCCDPEITGVTIIRVPSESGDLGGRIIIQGAVDGTIEISGSTETVTGTGGGSSVITSNALINLCVFVERGGVQIPGYDPGDGSQFYTKNWGDNFITYSSPLVSGEQIYIEAIPCMQTNDIVVVQAVVGGATHITGTFHTVTGITNGSSLILCPAFEGLRVYFERGGIQVLDVDPGDGSQYYTKVIEDNFITLSSPLVTGEQIYIETIPNEL